MECCAPKEGVLPVQQPKNSQDDKENIDPCIGQHMPSVSASGIPFMPATKQQFARTSTRAGKGRAPLADITAMCMLQASRPAHQQLKSGAAAGMQKGLWGQAQHADKLGGAHPSSGGAPSGGHRLAAMR